MRQKAAGFALFYGIMLAAAIGGEKQLVHAIVATVNGIQVTQADLREVAQFMLQRQFGEKVPRLTAEDESAIANAALRELIKYHLIKGEAQRLEIKVTVDEIDKHLRGWKLDPASAPLIARRFAEAELLFDQVLVKIGKPLLPASPARLREFYRQHEAEFRENCWIKVRHIFLATEDKKPDEVKAKIQVLYDKIAAKPLAERSAFFAEVARQFSEDAFAGQGGLILINKDPDGWFPQNFVNLREGAEHQPLFPDRMYKSLQELAYKGELQGPLQSDKGFHILYLEDIRGGRQIPFADVVKVIEYKLRIEDRQQHLREWLADIIGRSRITWHDGEPMDAAIILGEKAKPRSIK